MCTTTNASRTIGRFIAALLLAVGLTACSRLSLETKSGMASGQKVADQKSETEPGKAEVAIKIENFVYVPAEITIEPGTRVTWTNQDDAPHTATSTEEEFKSPALDTGDTYSFVFNDKGDYPYFCALHPHMKGRITVK